MLLPFGSPAYARRDVTRAPSTLPQTHLNTAIVTGSGGLIGSQAVRHFVQLGYEVIGFENDMRASFFGNSASTRRVTRELEEAYSEFHSLSVDIRDTAAIDRVFAQHKGSVELVVHTAAQPSHDWSAKDPRTDFSVNTYGTINLLEATRQFIPDATFIFTSTNKVYGDRPNSLPLEERETRYELPDGHRYIDGIDTTMSIDRSMHSPFGASKAAADLIVQEYGRYFGMPTVAFRGGCLTGPSHAGAQLHGFLSYLMRCTVTGEPYSVFGYKAKQVRDNIHSHDVVRAFEEFHSEPRRGAVYNLGGGRHSNCSMLEAIQLSEQIARRELRWTLTDEARRGDHQWWISDLREFEADYPGWAPTYDVFAILREIHDTNVERWTAEAA